MCILTHAILYDIYASCVVNCVLFFKIGGKFRCTPDGSESFVSKNYITSVLLNVVSAVGLTWLITY